MRPDYRKIPYKPAQGRRSLLACGIVCVVGFGLFFVPPIDVPLFGWHLSQEALAGALFFVGLVNMIPAIMMLTPPEKR